MPAAVTAGALQLVHALRQIASETTVAHDSFRFSTKPWVGIIKYRKLYGVSKAGTRASRRAYIPCGGFSRRDAVASKYPTPDVRTGRRNLVVGAFKLFRCLTNPALQTGSAAQARGVNQF